MRTEKYGELIGSFDRVIVVFYDGNNNSDHFERNHRLIALAFNGVARVYRVDVSIESNKELSSLLGIDRFPSYAIYVDGKGVKKLYGQVSCDQMQEYLQLETVEEKH